VGGSTARTNLLARAFPRFPHPVPVEVYRQIGKLRLVLAACFVAYNLLTGLSLDTLGLHRERWLLAQIPNLTLLVATALLGLVIWRGGLPASRLRQLTFVCVALEVGSLLVNLSLYGSLGSHITLVAMIVVLLYRATFDFRIGVWAIGLYVAGQVVLVGAEAMGWLEPQIAFAGGADQSYRSPERLVAIAPFVVLLEIVAFWAVNWLMARLHHKDRAIRMLRETLAAVEASQVGRHTGRTLRDTYLVEGLIGAGGMGEVYRGQHQRTHRPVAIKLLHPHLVDDPVLLARFRREAEIAGSVDSEHVVEVIDADVDDGQPFIVLELIDGRSLHDVVAGEGALAPERAAEIATQVAAGLRAAHAAAIVHRDLKPENIVLVEGPAGLRVKILDFGISKIRGNATAITHEVAILGTPDFMSPEQAVGLTDEVDERSDIFSLGAVAYFMLAGRRPFPAASVPAILRTICDEEPPRLAEVRSDLGPHAAQLAAVVEIAMAKRPQERYPTAAELADDLARAARGALPAEVLRRAAALHRGRPATGSVGDRDVDATHATLPASA
jgi:hypothetical protein